MMVLVKMSLKIQALMSEVKYHSPINKISMTECLMVQIRVFINSMHKDPCKK